MAEFDRLREPASRLGAAFQKVNFLRDMKSDFVDRGRTYFPGVDFSDFGRDAKQLIETDIQHDFDAAYIGIMKLPRGARMGVYLAYIYYQTLFNKIKQTVSLPHSERTGARTESTKIRPPGADLRKVPAECAVRLIFSYMPIH